MIKNSLGLNQKGLKLISSIKAELESADSYLGWNLGSGSLTFSWTEKCEMC